MEKLNKSVQKMKLSQEIDSKYSKTQMPNAITSKNLEVVDGRVLGRQDGVRTYTGKEIKNLFNPPIQSTFVTNPNLNQKLDNLQKTNQKTTQKTPQKTKQGESLVDQPPIQDPNSSLGLMLGAITWWIANATRLADEYKTSKGKIAIGSMKDKDGKATFGVIQSNVTLNDELELYQRDPTIFVVEPVNPIAVVNALQ